ncbi:MAG: hypothetical protein KatS3mg060_2308 [Dehalococcoidia bacterium]|nr:MAG: hypothetical protein KatS3mg060_2308 [Dehalococcoidia bacterium]
MPRRAVVGGRLLWVVTHLDYYVRAPLQVFVVVDGGLHPLGLVLGAAYALRSLRQRAPSVPPRALVEPLVVAVLAALLFERAGCAPDDLRDRRPHRPPPGRSSAGDEWRQPIALYQAVILATGLLLAVKWPCRSNLSFGVGLAALAVAELVAFSLGTRSVETLVALGTATVVYWVAERRTRPASGPSLDWYYSGIVESAYRRSGQPVGGAPEGSQ